MTKVGKSDYEGTFAGMRRDDEDAPIPAVGETTMEPPESSQIDPKGALYAIGRRSAASCT